MSRVQNRGVPLYTLLKGPIPVNLLKHKEDTDVADVVKNLVVCGVVTNYCVHTLYYTHYSY